MSPKISITLMILNGLFVIINAIFLAFGATPTIHLIAALWCSAGFVIALNHYLNGERNAPSDKNGN